MHNNKLVNAVKGKKNQFTFHSKMKRKDCTSGKCSTLFFFFSLGCSCFSGICASANDSRKNCASKTYSPGLYLGVSENLPERMSSWAGTS